MAQLGHPTYAGEIPKWVSPTASPDQVAMQVSQITCATLGRTAAAAAAARFKAKGAREEKRWLICRDDISTSFDLLTAELSTAKDRVSVEAQKLQMKMQQF